MAYLDSRLGSGEQVLRREHQHWFVVLADARYAIVMWLIALGLWIISGALPEGARPIVGWVIVILVVGGLLYAAWQLLRWQNEEFAVTSRPDLMTEGVLNKSIIDSSLEKINDAILTESVFGRIFGFGNLEILTASESGISNLRMLREADDF
jgi:uncharacterized membrane protein YdbT with pleckstrin-like domain